MGGFLKTTFGMTGSADRPLAGYSGEACVPSPSWIHRLIAQDRLRRRSR
jgi:hypothetical protein